MSIGHTGCMLTTGSPMYHSFFGVEKKMNSGWWSCEREQEVLAKRHCLPKQRTGEKTSEG